VANKLESDLGELQENDSVFVITEKDFNAHKKPRVKQA
jgi:hypothetical protein